MGANSHKPATANSVREQYEDYPYPYRDVKLEGTFYSNNDANSLLALSHAGWEGKRDLRHGTRILIAGCGTGDSTIEFAEETLGSDAQIVAIDLSSKSIEIAKARMAKRGLKNVMFQRLSILDAPSIGLGQFDIIESGGVLHHLPDPDAGLAALASMLKDDGLISVMVYAQYGRFAVYLIQELMKKLLTPAMKHDEKLAVARAFLNRVPNGHWITMNNALFLKDIQWPDGSGIYDLFLHSTDRAYTVPQLYDWVEGAGLTLTALFSDMADDSIYQPESYTAAPELLSLVAGQSPRERHAIAELLCGTMAKHSFYAAKQPKTPAQFADDMVIAYGPMQHLFLQFVGGFVAGLAPLAPGQQVNGDVRPFAEAPKLLLTKRVHTATLLQAIDSKRTIGELVAQTAAAHHAAPAEVRQDLEQLYRELRSCQLVFLRHGSIPPYPSGPDIIARVQKFQQPR